MALDRFVPGLARPLSVAALLVGLLVAPGVARAVG